MDLLLIAELSKMGDFKMDKMDNCRHFKRILAQRLLDLLMQ